MTVPDRTITSRAATIIVDPPRTGMSREALDGDMPAARRASRSTCRATWPRWRAMPGASWTAGTAIAELDAFDLFPNTPHVETVVVFDRT